MTEIEVLDALRQVMDPELGINIVDLGLVYHVDIGYGSLQVDLTMTTRACPMHAYLSDLAKNALSARFPDTAVEVKMVWEPPWDPSRMSEAARRQLG